MLRSRSSGSALDLNPNYPTAHEWFGVYLATRKRFEDAFREFERARQLDPLSPTRNWHVAWGW